MPIIHLGSMYSLRSSLYIRSVPMLPEPTIAAVRVRESLISRFSLEGSLFNW